MVKLALCSDFAIYKLCRQSELIETLDSRDYLPMENRVFLLARLVFLAGVILLYFFGDSLSKASHGFAMLALCFLLAGIMWMAITGRG